MIFILPNLREQKEKIYKEGNKTLAINFHVDYEGNFINLLYDFILWKKKEKCTESLRKEKIFEGDGRRFGGINGRRI